MQVRRRNLRPGLLASHDACASFGRPAQLPAPLAVRAVKEEDFVPGVASEHVDEIVRLWGLKLESDAGAKSGLDEEPLRLGGHSAGNLIQFRAKGNRNR